MIEWGDVATWVSGLATSVAVGFAAVQVSLLRRDAYQRQRVELEGVAVSWLAREVPTGPDPDGYSEALYCVTAHNPGRLPITDVVVAVTVPCDVQRVHYDGSLEAPKRGLRLDTPVIAGGGERLWERRLKIRYDQRALLREMQALIEFSSLLDHERHRNAWGRPPRQPK